MSGVVPANSASRARLRATSSRGCRRAARSCANSRPMPELAPVTSAMRLAGVTGCEALGALGFDGLEFGVLGRDDMGDSFREPSGESAPTN